MSMSIKVEEKLKYWKTINLNFSKRIYKLNLIFYFLITLIFFNIKKTVLKKTPLIGEQNSPNIIDLNENPTIPISNILINASNNFIYSIILNTGLDQKIFGIGTINLTQGSNFLNTGSLYINMIKVYYGDTGLGKMNISGIQFFLNDGNSSQIFGSNTKCTMNIIFDGKFSSIYGIFDDSTGNPLIGIGFYYELLDTSLFADCITTCNFNCKTFLDNCLINKGYYPNSNTAPVCNSNQNNEYFYLTQSGNFYDKCNSKCQTCNNPTTCTTCPNGSLLFSLNNLCYTAQDIIYHNNKYYLIIGQTFQPCDDSCTSCSGNTTTCLGCANGYYQLYDNINACRKPDSRGKYTDNSTGKSYFLDNQYLQNCYDKCAECSKKGDITNNNCDLCKAGYFPIEDQSGMCENNIISNKYFDNVKNKCYYLDLNRTPNTLRNCHPNCSECTTGPVGNNQNCDSCESSFYFLEDIKSCVPNNSNKYYDTISNTGYFLDSTSSSPIFRKCYNTCQYCSTNGSDLNNNCDTCKQGYYLIEGFPNTCKAPNTANNNYFDSNTNNAYFLDLSAGQFIFRKCYETCASCDYTISTLSHNCLSCKPGYYKLFENQKNCLSNQLDNYFVDSTDNFLKKCYEKCKTCSSSGDANNQNCKTCIDKYFFLNDKRNCYLNAPEGYYFNSTLNKFDNCYKTCKLCTGFGDEKGNNCIECKDKYYPSIYDSKMCFQNPVDYYYFDENQKKFIPCSETCKTCSGSRNEKSNNCLKCKEGFYLKIDDPGNCKNTIDEGYYYNNKTQYIEKCYSTCKSCMKGLEGKNQNCVKCVDNYYFKNPNYINNEEKMNCYEKTLEGFFLNSNSTYIEPCFMACKTCDILGDSFNSKCNKCADNFYGLIDDMQNCKATPPIDYYIDKEKSVFIKCNNIGNYDKENSKILSIVPNSLDMKTRRNIIIKFSKNIMNGINGRPSIKEVYLQPNNKTIKYNLKIDSVFCNSLNVTFDPNEIIKNLNNDKLNNNVRILNQLKLIKNKYYNNLDEKVIYDSYEIANKTPNPRNSRRNKFFKNNSFLVNHQLNFTFYDNLIFNKRFEYENINKKINYKTFKRLLQNKEGMVAGDYNIVAVDENNIKIFSNLTNLRISISSVKVDSIQSSNITSSVKNFLVENPSFNPVILTKEDGTVNMLYNLSENSMKEARALSIQNKISFVDFDGCLDTLQKYYGINKTQLVAVKIDLPSKKQNEPSKYNGYQSQFQIFDLKGDKIDLSPCDNTKIISYIPIKPDSPINLTFAGDFEKNLNVSVYNGKDDFYNDICFSYSNGNNDLTLNNRRKDIYPNTTISCSLGCNFTQIDTTIGYTKCECKGSAVENVAVDYIMNALDALLNNNLKLVVCVFQVFVADKIIYNLAFIFTLTLFFLIFLEIIIFYFLSSINEKNIRNIINSDGTYFEYIKEKNKKLKESLETKRLSSKENVMIIINNNELKNFNFVENKDNYQKSNENEEKLDKLNEKNKTLDEQHPITDNFKGNSIAFSIESYNLAQLNSINNIPDDIKDRENLKILFNNHIVNDKNKEVFQSSIEIKYKAEKNERLKIADAQLFINGRNFYKF